MIVVVLCHLAIRVFCCSSRRLCDQDDPIENYLSGDTLDLSPFSLLGRLDWAGQVGLSRLG